MGRGVFRQYLVGGFELGRGGFLQVVGASVVRVKCLGGEDGKMGKGGAKKRKAEGGNSEGGEGVGRLGDLRGSGARSALYLAAIAFSNATGGDLSGAVLNCGFVARSAEFLRIQLRVLKCRDRRVSAICLHSTAT